jgi:hypothetical protein
MNRICQNSQDVKGGPLPRFATDLLRAVPPAGAGVNLWLYRVARILHAYRTSDEIADLLRASSVDCGRVVEDAEIVRAVARSAANAYRPGHRQVAPSSTLNFPSFDPDRRAGVLGGRGLADLEASSPVQCSPESPTAAGVLRALFPDPTMLLCLGPDPRRARTRLRDEWLPHAASHALIVPSPMTEERGITQSGRMSHRALSNTGPRRYLVVEQDRGSIDEQAAVILHLAEYAPLTLACSSGGKSIHAWFFVADESEEILRDFFTYAVALGADPQLWVRCQLARLPGGLRDGKIRQRLFYYDQSAT